MTDTADCIFCKIVRGDLPSTQVFSDDLVLAFRDISPVTPSHVLVIPKAHVEFVVGLDESHEELIGHMVTVAGDIARGEGLIEPGYRLVINQGDDAGQMVDHLHLHVLGGREMGRMG